MLFKTAITAFLLAQTASAACVYFCSNDHFNQPCRHECFDGCKNFDVTIASIGPDQGSGCDMYTGPDCTNQWGGALYWPGTNGWKIAGGPPAGTYLHLAVKSLNCWNA